MNRMMNCVSHYVCVCVCVFKFFLQIMYIDDENKRIHCRDVPRFAQPAPYTDKSCQGVGCLTHDCA
jgi:hypothetical protein